MAPTTIRRLNDHTAAALDVVADLLLGGDVARLAGLPVLLPLLEIAIVLPAHERSSRAPSRRDRAARARVSRTATLFSLMPTTSATSAWLRPSR
jgi:hypothetical protein